MNLAHATKLAARIHEEIAPLCVPGCCEIAGSIRRGRPEVNDLDFVCVPLDQYALRARILRHATPIQDGPQILTARLANGAQLDIFFARPATQDLLDKRPTNYGSILLCRTGSKEHNIKIAIRAQRLGLQWNPSEGLFHTLEFAHHGGPLLIASETEEQIFRALQMDYLEPKERE